MIEDFTEFKIDKHSTDVSITKNGLTFSEFALSKIIAEKIGYVSVLFANDGTGFALQQTSDVKDSLKIKLSKYIRINNKKLLSKIANDASLNLDKEWAKFDYIFNDNGKYIFIPYNTIRRFEIKKTK